MKNYKKALMAASIVILPMLVSCEKDGSALFKGNYSFKTSGNISVVRDEAFQNDTTYSVSTITTEDSIIPQVKIDTIVTVHDDTLTVMIDNEAGIMDITEIDAETGASVITLNVTGGEVVAYYASAEGRSITIEPLKRYMRLMTGSLLDGSGTELDGDNVMGEVNISGTGNIYDNIIIFDLDYSGDFTCNGILYHITSSDVICRAKKTE